MQIKLFTIPINLVSDHNEDLNAFLRAHKVIDVEKQLVETSSNAYWCIYISYVLGSTSKSAYREKIDYMKILEPEIFARFSKLREIRKKIAADDGVSAYVVFTDAELAEIAKLPDLNVTKLKGIKGIGDKKAGKYGEAIIKIFKTEKNEKGQGTDTGNSLF